MIAYTIDVRALRYDELTIGRSKPYGLERLTHQSQDPSGARRPAKSRLDVWTYPVGFHAICLLQKWSCKDWVPFRIPTMLQSNASNMDISRRVIEYLSNLVADSSIISPSSFFLPSCNSSPSSNLDLLLTIFSAAPSTFTFVLCFDADGIDRSEDITTTRCTFVICHIQYPKCARHPRCG